ncbi:hypothetical protein GCM10011416_19910 [Polaribacter pacificus]|uniref:ATP-cone domain-containing protein n=1 Tax=Polaribacter pacificus TaxID=1775173 RepID=A0A917MF41_9FLAO|nr:ATP cone domain-containing protein [Polaribacter pacificus]GGH01230.1 hypothetical protein GCM10011416_19910 [Polaribacter pacificus]
MKNNRIEITKSSGRKVRFSLQKLRRSLRSSGANKLLVNQILDKVRDQLYQGISTKEIYNLAFDLLKKERSYYASKFKLKKALYELGPTGFPFERYVSAILSHSGYFTEVGKILQGNCVRHEIDVLAYQNNETTVIECKFHTSQGLNCDVKVPLYIHSRYNDVKANWNADPNKITQIKEGWVVTNTRFTEDALQYGSCVGLYLLSWDYPKGNALKDRIDQLHLYPITVSTLLSSKEKQNLLDKEIVLCRELLDKPFLLQEIGVSELRAKKIIHEISELCTHKTTK